MITTQAQAIDIKPIEERPEHMNKLMDALGLDNSQQNDVRAARMTNYFPFNYESMFEGTGLSTRVRESKHVYVSGEDSMADYEYLRVTDWFLPDQMVFLFWNVVDRKEGVNYVGFALERHEKLSLYANTGTLIQSKPDKYDIAGFFEDDREENKLTAHSLRLLPQRLAARNPFINEIVERIEVVLKTHYDGFRLVIHKVNFDETLLSELFEEELPKDFPHSTYYINGGARMVELHKKEPNVKNYDELYNMAQLIMSFIDSELEKYPQVHVNRVYHTFKGVHPNFVDSVVESQYETSGRAILRKLKTPARLSTVIENYLLSLSVEVMA